MNQRNKKNTGGIRHARKDNDFYLKVFRHQITGHSAADISKWLKTPAITVRRTMKKFRNILLKHPPILDHIRKLAFEVKISHGFVIEDLRASLWHYYQGGSGISFSDFHECFTNCNLKKTPRQLRKDRMTFLNYPRAGYCFTFPLIDPDDELLAYLNRVAGCKYCPMKKMQSGCHSHFLEDPQLYVDIVYHLSNFRLKNPSNLDLLHLYLEALNISYIQAILVKKMNLLAFELDDEAETMAALEAFFLTFSQELFDLMNDAEF